MTTAQAPTLVGRAIYRLHPDDAEAFTAISARLAETGDRQPGCVFFHAAQDLADRSLFYLFEGWDTAASVDAFHATDAFAGLLGEASALHILERSGHAYTISDATEIVMPTADR